jgi:hypothetical protein
MIDAAVQTTPSRYLRPIRRGEYDIANVSIIGHDPTDGRSYEECHAEWQREFDRVQEARRITRRWNLRARLRHRFQIAALATHLGMS